jgi:GNAT superfamily N-acetyltransferase
MPSITIRQVEGQEMLDILYVLDNYAFRPTPPFPNREEWEQRLKTRKGPIYYALFEEDDPVAITACPTLIQNVRGKIFKMGGFADVSTHPRARRKGYSRQLIRYAYEQLKNDGRVVSSLYPFRESFYERLGYVTFPQSRLAIFNTADVVPLLKNDLGGEVELMLIGEGYDDYAAYVQEMLPGVHGMAMFEDPQKESALQNRSWLAQAKVAGELVGLMVYITKGEEMMNYTFHALRFYYKTSQGKYLLLAWLGQHIDQTTKAELRLPAYEQPNTWLADLRPKLEPVFVAPMGRVLDVAGLSGLKTFQVFENLEGLPRSFSAKISDPDCPWNNGSWKFVGDQGTLEVSPAQNADCNLTIQGLSALVYGVNDPADFAIRGWGDPSPEVAAVMRAMFPPQLPYLHEYY